MNLELELIKNTEKKLIAHNIVETQYEYDHMVYIRLFEGCNLHCEHCFIPSNPKKIQSSFYENNGLTNELINKVKGLKEGDRIYLQWHGGEPTLLGVEYLRNAIENVIADKRFKYINGIQTNLMNFHEKTEQWLNLYKDYFNNRLGVSWDYKIRHLRNSNLNEEENYQKFEKIFWNNIKLAQDHGIELYMVITVNKLFFEHFKNPFDFFDFISKKGIQKINFERITKTGFARKNWEKLGLSNKEYSFYMSRFFKAYKLFKKNNPNIILNISPFDGLEISVINYFKKKQKPKIEKANIWDIMSFKNQGYGCWSGECDTRFHTIDSNGYKQGCTALNSEQDNKNKIISGLEGKIIWLEKLQFQDFKEQRAERQLSCEECEFIKICSSGCLSVEKFDDSQECSGAKTLFKTIKNYHF
jgi:radical SAM protein with 4Fe4S-binding SPASM domain